MSDDLNPFATIWRHPGTTLQALFKHDPKELLPVAIAGGIADFFVRAFARAPHSPPPAGQFWGLVLLGGALWGICWVYGASFALHRVGHWQGGRAPFQSILTVVTWSRLPLAVSLVWWIPATLLFGTALLTLGALDEPNSIEALVMAIGALVGGVSVLWGWFLIVRGIQIAEGFSVGRALGTLALVLLLLVVIVITLVFVLVFAARWGGA